MAITARAAVEKLAKASEDQVLRLWQGLGYYSRARNLLAAARQVAHEHGGHFPANHAALRNLKGVGDYTASAIASICFGLPEPVVDGNVYRVLSRVFGIGTPIDSNEGRKEFRALAAQLIDPKHPGDHNQAVMELGAMVCTPKNPACDRCPVASRCIALRTQSIAELPVKAGNTKTRTRHFNYLRIETGSGIYLRKRAAKDIWQGLWELPLIETEKAAGPKTMQRLIGELDASATKRASNRGKKDNCSWTIRLSSAPVKHVLSHQLIHARFWEATPPPGFVPPKDWKLVPWKRLDAHALPRLVEKALAGRG